MKSVYKKGRRSFKIATVYVPDIWRIHNRVDVIKLTLLRGLFTKILLKSNLTLIDFLMMICNSSGKINFIRRGDFISIEYVALWTDENYVSNKTRGLIRHQEGEDFYGV